MIEKGVTWGGIREGVSTVPSSSLSRDDDVHEISVNLPKAIHVFLA